MKQGTCAHCRAPFSLTRSDQRFCSTRCSNAGNTRRCEREGCNRPHRAKGLCNRHYKDERYPDQAYAFPDDPEAKRKRDLAKAKRRRAAQRRSDAEDVDRDRVGERDGWRCGICHRKVNRRRAYPDPLSPSLDHVVPISRGGPHTYANTRITHLRCNLERGNRGGNEQLALLG
ncbi:HNH endonuclease [Micromonospora humida]|uniref:HNH endonuclease n=1 Tax=Micromonospora humida TaxID=2809018 RepID=UPI00366AD2E6